MKELHDQGHQAHFYEVESEEDYLGVVVSSREDISALEINEIWKKHLNE